MAENGNAITLEDLERVLLPVVLKLNSVQAGIERLERQMGQLETDIKAVRQHCDYKDYTLNKISGGYESVRSDVTRLTMTVEPCIHLVYGILCDTHGTSERLRGRIMYNWRF